MNRTRSARPQKYPFTVGEALAPPDEWADLRHHCPLAPVSFPSGDEAVLLTRYEDERTDVADPRLTREGLTRPDAARITAGDAEGIFSSPMAKTLNAEGHDRWRRMVGKWFTTKRMSALRPEMEDVTDRLVDTMTEQGAPADLVSHVAFPLPVYVICTMLGVPEHDRDAASAGGDGGVQHSAVVGRGGGEVPRGVGAQVEDPLPGRGAVPQGGRILAHDDQPRRLMLPVCWPTAAPHAADLR
jgi:cytochrome P450